MYRTLLFIHTLLQTEVSVHRPGVPVWFPGEWTSRGVCV